MSAEEIGINSLKQSRGLDPIIREEFLESVLQRHLCKGRTVFFSSHHFDDVERVADEVGIFVEGRFSARGKIDELRSTVKRVQIVLPDGKLPAYVPEQAVFQRLSRRDWLVTVGPFSEDLLEQLLSDNNAIEGNVVDLSLEDIFKDMIRGLLIWKDFRLLRIYLRFLAGAIIGCFVAPTVTSMLAARGGGELLNKSAMLVSTILAGGSLLGIIAVVVFCALLVASVLTLERTDRSSQFLACVNSAIRKRAWNGPTLSLQVATPTISGSKCRMARCMRVGTLQSIMSVGKIETR